MTASALVPALAAQAVAHAAEPLPAALVADLRTDHAGETGAVMIYRGILAFAKDPAVRRFAQEHLATEATHLAALETLLAPRERSRLLPLWRCAGWLTGALPASVGPQLVYATIQAVETFVDRHYAEQIEAINRLDPSSTNGQLQALKELLQTCRDDEVAHRDEAASLLHRPAEGPPWALWALSLWIRLVSAGSAAAVKVCRRI